MHWRLTPLLILVLGTNAFTSNLLLPRQETSSKYNDTISKVWGWGNSLLGTEHPSICAGEINLLLKQTGDYNKWGSAVTATILTLLPALLTVGPYQLRNFPI
jgi:hypothetical protein